MNDLRSMSSFMKKLKKVVFVSNFFNHHQKPFSDAMYVNLGDGYRFIETEPMSEERKRMGWEVEGLPAYVISSEQFKASPEGAIALIDQADIVIFGSAPEHLLVSRKKAKKIIFRYSERPLKKGFEVWKYPFRVVKWFLINPPFKPVYMLGASAYTASDYSKFGQYIGKCYKWGYFPQMKRYDIDVLINNKQENSILWVARFIDWKHPEVALEVAKRLKSDGYKFKLRMIGIGALESKMRAFIKDNDLFDCVEMLGVMNPEQVREHMEKSEIFLFTSDRNEGWGAVLNESMNSACAVVANQAIGSVPFLIKDGENGYTYKDGDIDVLFNRVKLLLCDADNRKHIALNAYATIINEWNAENAAEKLIALGEAILNGNKKAMLYDDGVCSKVK